MRRVRPAQAVPACATMACVGGTGPRAQIGAPLVRTKLHVPGGRVGAVHRPRLAAGLARALTAKLTLVSAPAGFGKTTMLAQWLAATGQVPGGPAVAWVSLDEHDDDVGRFWSYVVAALARVSDTVDAEALPLLQGPTAASEAAMASLLNALGELPRDVVLVLDDYHAVTSREIHDAVGYLLDHLPPQVHLVLSSRSDPPLQLPRLRARGDLVEVRSADLRFTRDEAAQYLVGSMGLELAAADVTLLAERTEGWAAALQLAGLSLRDRDDTAEAVAAFAGDDRFIVDFLAEEVLTRLPVDVREFLLRTSVLRRLTGPLCDAVTGQRGGAARLVDLERANMFLVPLDDHREWYRYHHLFGDVLRAHLAEQHRDEVAALHRRASDWWHHQGDAAQAVEHALAAADLQRAAELMELAIPLMARARREGELASWVGALPEEVVRTRPVLAVALAGALAQVSDFGTVAQRLDDVERLLVHADGEWPTEPPAGLIVIDLDGFHALPAMVHMYRSALALFHGDPAGTLDLAQRALQLAPESHHLLRAGARALAGLAAWSLGDLSGAQAAYTDSAVDMRRAGHLADVLGLCVTIGDLYQAQGRLTDAERTYRDALDLSAAADGAPLRGTADMHVGLAGVLLERGDLAGAAAELLASDSLGEHKALPKNPYRSRVLHAWLAEADGDLAAALSLLDDADRVYNGDYSPNVQPVPALRARLRLRRGELDAAEAWVRERHLAAGDELSYLREYEHITLARILLAQHHAGEAGAAPAGSAPLQEGTSLLQRLASAAEAGGRERPLLEILVLLAQAHLAHKERDIALSVLRRATSLAEREGYVHVFTADGPVLRSLLRDLSRAQTGSGYLRRLALASEPPPGPDAGVGARTLGDRAHGADRRGFPALVEPLSGRELDVLRLLATDLDGPDIARELHISLNTMRTHSRNIFRKFQVTSRRAAVRQAVELDLLPRQHHS
jgi:LuxR family maltose regulon positive regulatory protein